MGFTELQRLEELARGIGHAVGGVLDDHSAENPKDARVGFVLWMFTFGPGGWATYVSNAKREDMIQALKELLWKLKGISSDRTPQDYENEIAQLKERLGEVDPKR